MKILSLRALGRDAPELHESVLVTHANVVIGVYRPVDAPPAPEVPWTVSEITASSSSGSSIVVPAKPRIR